MAKSITEIDVNLKSTPLGDGLSFYEVRNTNAHIYGLAKTDNGLFRLPLSLKSKMNDEINYLQTNTSGARVRFIVGGKRLGIKLHITNTEGFAHMPYSGYAGIDCFAGEGVHEQWLGVRWPLQGQDVIETEFVLSGAPTIITLYLPLYTGVSKLYLGVEQNEEIKAPTAYKYETPIIFYGSSITQGGCASRASNSYPALVCRWLESNFVNLGFSGNAKGEEWMAQYIASQPMRAFVYDYDHNAPNPAHLRHTHLPFLLTILEKTPALPIIMLSKPNPNLSGEDYERREIIKESYEKVRASGANVTFIDGDLILGELGRESCTVDGVHPNDLGFWRMAQAVHKELSAVL